MSGGSPGRVYAHRSGGAFEQFGGEGYVDAMRVIGGGFREDLSALKAVGDNVLVHETAILINPDNIELGSNVRIDPFCIVSAAGGFVRIGNYVHIAAGAKVFGGAGVIMEDFSGLSHNVCVYSVSDDYSGRHLTNPTVPERYLGCQRGEITIGRHAIVGSGSVILPGCCLDEGVAVGALSLVTKSLGMWSVYAGMPARRIRSRSMDLLHLEGIMREQGLLQGN